MEARIIMTSPQTKLSEETTSVSHERVSVGMTSVSHERVSVGMTKSSGQGPRLNTQNQLVRRRRCGSRFMCGYASVLCLYL